MTKQNHCGAPAQAALEPGVLDRLKRWRDVGDGPLTYCAGSKEFADDVIRLIGAFEASQPPAAPVEDRKTFTIPPGYEAVRDSEGRATGEVRPTTAPRSELRFSEQSWSHEEREIRAPAAPVETEEYPLYSASIAWSDEDNAYIGTIRELPGCCADGATPEECIRELKDAKAAWIEACKAAGKPVPAPAKFQPSHLPCSAGSDALDRQNIAKAIAHDLEEGPAHGARVATTPHLDNYHVNGHVNLLALADAVLAQIRVVPQGAPK